MGRECFPFLWRTKSCLEGKHVLVASGATVHAAVTSKVLVQLVSPEGNYSQRFRDGAPPFQLVGAVPVSRCPAC